MAVADHWLLTTFMVSMFFFPLAVKIYSSALLVIRLHFYITLLHRSIYREYKLSINFSVDVAVWSFTICKLQMPNDDAMNIAYLHSFMKINKINPIRKSWQRDSYFANFKRPNSFIYRKLLAYVECAWNVHPFLFNVYRCVCCSQMRKGLDIRISDIADTVFAITSTFNCYEYYWYQLMQRI